MRLQGLFSLRNSLVLAAALAAGCTQTNKTESTATSDSAAVEQRRNTEVASAQPAAQPAAAPSAPAAQPGEGPRGSIALPTGDPATSVLMIEKSLPAEIIAGQQFSYDIKVTNLTKGRLDNVDVAETVASNVKLGEGAGQVRDGMVHYAVGSLAAGESKAIRVNATATGGESVRNCLSATYNTALCLSAPVVSPALRLAKSAPAEVLICEAIPVKLTITNSGSGAARNVRIEDALPAGLTTEDGKNNISIAVGTLTAGETKSVTFNVKATKTGKFDNKARASADNGLNAESETTSTVVRQPVLAITKTGPAKAFLGRPVTYDIVVTNKGDGVARNTVISDLLPVDAKFASATENGSYSSGKVNWNLGDLAPGATRKVSVTLAGAGSAGAYKNTVSVGAKCADTATATTETEFTGIPALLLECVDVTDPLEVGKDQTYVITVTNQGSAPGTNIKIACALEDQMQFVSADGASKGNNQGKNVMFDALPSLAPKAVATWKVVVKATGEGDVRFKVSMTAAELQRPVEETESSNFFK